EDFLILRMEPRLVQLIGRSGDEATQSAVMTVAFALPFTLPAALYLAGHGRTFGGPFPIVIEGRTTAGEQARQCKSPRQHGEGSGTSHGGNESNYQTPERQCSFCHCL